MFGEKEICRTCLTSARELLPLSACVEMDFRIIDYFKMYLNYTIHEDDQLPQSICLKCLDHLLDTKKFHQQCRESEEFLKNKLVAREAPPHLSIKEEDASTVEGVSLKIENLCEEGSNSADDIISYSPLEECLIPIESVEEEYKCAECNECFKYEKNYKMHLRLFHNNKDEKEDQAVNIEFDVLESYISDESVTSKEHYVCKDCNCSFRYRKNFENHVKRHIQQDEQPTGYKCPQCELEFYSQTSMHKHFTKVHIGENESCLCPNCGLHISSKAELDEHLLSHKTTERRYDCEFCGKSFLRKDGLICHRRTHTGERPFECEICRKRFTQKNALTTHMTLHTGKTVKCPLCDKTFSRPSFLKVHNREHTDERPYACKLCPKRYRQMTHLKTHENTHFDSRPFSCTTCGKAFSQKSTLHQHLFVHIGKPFKCSECSMEFCRPYRLRNHLVSAHNIHDDQLNNYRQDLNKEYIEEEFLDSESLSEDKNDLFEITKEDIEIDVITDNS